MKLLASLLLLQVFSVSALGAVVLEDDFDGASLDLSKWQVVVGTVTQSGGKVNIGAAAGRDYMVSVGQWNPADGVLTVSGRISNMSDFEIWTRAANVQDLAFAGGTLDSGIRIGGWATATDILEKASGNAWVAAAGSPGTPPFQGAPVDFLITDDGTNLSIKYTLVSDPLQTITVPVTTGLPAQTANHIGFGGTGQIQLDNVVVKVGNDSAENPSPINRAVSVPVAADLEWTAPSDLTDPAYTVYFDDDSEVTESPLAIIAVAQGDPETVLNADLPALAEGVEYFWRVDSIEDAETYAGEVWSFTTVGLEPVDPYNVYWNSPSVNSHGSMPLGNGDIAINLWAVENDDLIFYISKTDAWDDSGRLCKIGKLRVNISSDPFDSGYDFDQALRLGSGDILINAGPVGARVSLKVWVDANRPVIHIESTSDQSVTLQADLELWRTEERTLDGSVGHNNDETTVSDMYGNLTGPDIYPTIIYPDTIVSGQTDRIVWNHHNQYSGWQFSLAHQSLDGAISALGLTDPLQDRIWGAVVKGNGFTSVSDTSIVSQTDTNHDLQVHVLTDTQSSQSQWLTKMNTKIAETETVSTEQAYQEHLEWWHQYWQRSWIHISSDQPQQVNNAKIVSRGYARQRFLDACAGRGAYPVKFNGTLFTIEYAKATFSDPDYRQWGPGYWMQNTRLIYWSKLMSGDWDILQPFFDMYVDTLPLREYSTQHYYGHAGAWYPETFWFFGTMPNDVYGWYRSGKPIGWIEEAYTRYEIQGGLELASMMLDYYTYSGDEQFLTQKALPLIDSLLTYYLEHFKYQRDANNNQIGTTENYDPEGKLIMYPLNSLEMYWGVTNGTPDVAGLHKNVSTLLAIDPSLTTQVQRDLYAEAASRLPDLPMREVNGSTAIGFAEEPIPGASNYQNPELQAIFPFRLFGVGKDQLDMAIHTFQNRVIDNTGGWYQDAIHAAMVGLENDARDDIVHNFSTPDPSFRFPGFYGPNFDWTPDQDHVGVPCIALQRMIMQCEGDDIILFPAWPADWDVSFKLHAPGNTLVECELKAGEISRLLVTPASRRSDIITTYTLPVYLQGDLDGDGKVNLIDLEIFVGDWLSVNTVPSDINESGRVDFVDYSLFADDWLKQ